MNNENEVCDFFETHRCHEQVADESLDPVIQWAEGSMENLPSEEVLGWLAQDEPWPVEFGPNILEDPSDQVKNASMTPSDEETKTPPDSGSSQDYEVGSQDPETGSNEASEPQEDCQQVAEPILNKICGDINPARSRGRPRKS